MKHLLGIVASLLLCTFGTAWAGAAQEKVDLDKLPKEIVAAVKAKLPKAELKHATKENDDGKVVYEVSITIGKQAMHAMVTAQGKLYELHKEIDAKDVPAKAAKAVQAKYPKAKWEGVEQITDPDGKILAYEVVVEAAMGAFVEVLVDPDGKIRKETKIEPKK